MLPPPFPLAAAGLGGHEQSILIPLLSWAGVLVSKVPDWISLKRVLGIHSVLLHRVK
jgi:hypothetical protein